MKLSTISTPPMPITIGWLSSVLIFITFVLAVFMCNPVLFACTSISFVLCCKFLLDVDNRAKSSAKSKANKSREKEKIVDQKKKMTGGRVCNKRKING